jgi:hypothetical protein
MKLASIEVADLADYGTVRSDGAGCLRNTILYEDASWA